MKQAAYLLALGVLLTACAPGAYGPPPGAAGYQVGPYPTSARALRQGEDGVFLALGPEGPALGLETQGFQATLVGVGGWIGGAKARVAGYRDALSLAGELSYLAYTLYDDESGEEVAHEVYGLAVDASWTWPLSARYGEAYAGPRLRAYLGSDNGRLGYGVLPGVTLGVRVPVPELENRLTLGLEASLFLVSPLWTDQPHWAAFSPLGLTLTYRF